MEINNLLRMINDKALKKWAEIYNDCAKEEPVSELLDIPMYINDELILGGCPRKICFEQLGFPFSNITLYDIEKDNKDNAILDLALEKLSMNLEEIYPEKEYEIYNSLYFDDYEYKKDFINFNNEKNCVVVDLKNFKRKHFFYKLINSDKVFRNSDTFAIEVLPFIIYQFATYDGIEEINIIMKHKYSFEEKGISFTKAQYMDTEVIVIDNKVTSFDINKYKKLIKDTAIHLMEYINKKEFSPIRNLKKCNECHYKDFCNTFA